MLPAHTNHEALWMMAVAASWVLGHMGAPVWMPIAAASLVAVSLWLDLRDEIGRNPQSAAAQRVAINAIGRCSTHAGVVLATYLGGMFLSRLFS